jgi:hypothetical protein
MKVIKVHFKLSGAAVICGKPLADVDRYLEVWDGITCLACLRIKAIWEGKGDKKTTKLCLP